MGGDLQYLIAAIKLSSYRPTSFSTKLARQTPWSSLIDFVELVAVGDRN
jgi:hypothetical protein